METPAELTRRIVEAARREGFDRCAAAPVRALVAAPRLRRWLQEGLHADMAWLERDVDRRTDPRNVVPGARSVLIVTRSYYTDDPIVTDAARGRISRYAWGDEYHEVMGQAIGRLYERIQRLVPTASGRYYVDTGPVMEKAWAELAGLGWIGKHTNLLTRGEGSWFFLGAIILDLELHYAPPARDHCGTCTACIDVCPTQAIVAPYVLDANRCIAYLTIENRGPIPPEMRSAIGNRIFGCDDCQDVCPWNRFAQVAAGAAAFAARPENRAPELIDLLQMDEEAFRARFRHSPIRRAKYGGFLRNVAVALGNCGDRSAVPPLAAALEHPVPLVRGHCAWALGRLGGEQAKRALAAALAHESDPDVRSELGSALDMTASG